MKIKSLRVLTGIVVGVMGSCLLFGCGKKEIAEEQTIVEQNTEPVEETTTAKTEETEDAVKQEPIEEVSYEDIEPLAISIPGDYENIYQEDSYETVYEQSCKAIVVLNDGYDALQKELQTEAYQNKKEMDMTYDEVKSLQESGEETYNFPWQYHSNITVERADSVLLSYWRESYANLGGAHPNFNYTGYTFESSTGRRLHLWDVVKLSEDGSNPLYDVVVEKLKNEYGKIDLLFSDWEDTVAADFYGDGDIQFTISPEELTIIFNRYEIAPYAGGEIEVKLPLDEYGYLIEDKYLYNNNYLCRSIDSYGGFSLETTFDANGDGIDEILQVDTDMNWNEEYQYVESTDLIICLGETYDEMKGLRTEAGYSDLGTGSKVLMEAPDGKFYLYVDCLEENDYRTIKAFDVSDPNEGPIELGYYWDEESGAMYDTVPQNAESFDLFSRIQFMGTFDGYRKYTIGEDGFPTRLEEEWRIVSYNYSAAFDPSIPIRFSNEEYGVFTALMDVECERFENINDRGSLKKDVIKTGTKLFPYATDAKTYFIIRSSDEVYYKITIDSDADEMWYRTINGIPEEQVFDGIIYAG